MRGALWLLLGVKDALLQLGQAVEAALALLDNGELTDENILAAIARISPLLDKVDAQYLVATVQVIQEEQRTHQMPPNINVLSIHTAVFCVKQMAHATNALLWHFLRTPGDQVPLAAAAAGEDDDRCLREELGAPRRLTPVPVRVTSVV